MKTYKRNKGEKYRDYLSRIAHVADTRLLALEKQTKYDIRNTPEFSSAYAYAQQTTGNDEKPRFRRNLNNLSMKEVKDRIKEIETFLGYSTSTLTGVKNVSKEIDKRFRDKLEMITGDENVDNIPQDFYRGLLDKRRSEENDALPPSLEGEFGKYVESSVTSLLEYSDERLKNAQILYKFYGTKKYKRDLEYEQKLNDYLHRNKEYLKE